MQLARSLLALPLVAIALAQLGCGSDPSLDRASIEVSSEAASAAVDLTAQGTIIAKITSPTGGGSRNLELIRDGVFPPQGSSDDSKQYDTYAGGGSRTEDFFGYQYGSTQTFGSVVFQTGKQFFDGGWFTSLKVQVRRSGAWVDVSGSTVAPAFGGHDSINYKTYSFSFPATTGDAIRIYGVPGGGAMFVSIAELRVYAPEPANTTPTANAGANQTVAGGATVTLNGSASSDPNGSALSYSWTQTAGPAVTLNGATTDKPTFVAPSSGNPAAVTFSLVVRNANSASTAATTTVSITPTTTPMPAQVDLTPNGSIIALVTRPIGGGNKNIETIRDGVYPPEGSTNSAQQYDTYTGTSRSDEWIGYQFSSAQSFGSVVFQPGIQFVDGGWFASLKLQVRQGGTWIDVPSVTITPAYVPRDGVSFRTRRLEFPAISGDGIRIFGAPGGSATFVSVGELRVYSSGAPAAAPAPTAVAGSNQNVTSGASVTLDGSGSYSSDGASLSYAWSQTSGPAVTLSGAATAKPSFSAPAVSSATNLGFNLLVRNANGSSAPASVSVTVTPAPPPEPSGPCTAGGGPCVRQAYELALGDDNEAKHSLTFAKALLPGSTVLVFTVDMNLNGSPVGTGTPPPMAISDSDKGSYSELLTVLDTADWDAVKVFTRSNVPGGNLSVQAIWKTNQWHALMVVEVANVGGSPLIRTTGKTNYSAPQTKDAASSGTLSLGGSPALLVGLGVNFRDVQGDEGSPYAGTGFTGFLKSWNWNGKEGTSLNPTALLESAYFSKPGDVAATFTPSPSYQFNDHVMAIAVSFQ